MNSRPLPFSLMLSAVLSVSALGQSVHDTSFYLHDGRIVHMPDPQPGRFDVDQTIEEMFEIKMPSDRVFVAGRTEDWDLEVLPGGQTDAAKEKFLGDKPHITIPIQRYFGEVNIGGKLVHFDKMVERRMISEDAILIVAHWDYDVGRYNASGLDCCYDAWGDDGGAPRGLPASGGPPDRNDCETGCPECRDIYLNLSDSPLEKLASSPGEGNTSPSEPSWDQKWVLTAHRVKVKDLFLPPIGTGGQPPSGSPNSIQVQMGAGGTGQTWRGKIDWAALVIRTVSPVMLIHGNSSEAAFWNRRGFAEYLKETGWPFNGCAVDPVEPGGVTCENEITLATQSVANNAKDLESKLSQSVGSLGVDSVHIVAHSKGGLDTREYLAEYYDPSKFAVETLTTLGTPHDGSVGADIQDEYRAYTDLGYWVWFDDFPSDVSTMLLAYLVRANNGTNDLTMLAAADFNFANVPKLEKLKSQGDIFAFSTVGADADRDVVGPDAVDKNDEWIELMHEYHSNPNSTRIPDTAFGAIAGTMYEILRFVPWLVIDPPPAPVRIIAPPGQGSGRANDTMVPLPSARGADWFGNITSQAVELDGTTAKNHSSIADEEVAEIVVQRLLKLEELNPRGDLR